jgi:hypothetical protein
MSASSTPNGALWLIPPALRLQRQRAEFYQLDAQGSYQITVPAADGSYRSAVLPELWLKVAWLWQEPLPSVEHVLLTIDRTAYESYLEQLRTQGELP